jgi:hypothetical protein
MSYGSGRVVCLLLAGPFAPNGDDGGRMHVSLDEAQKAADNTRRVPQTVRTTIQEAILHIEDNL